MLINPNVNKVSKLNNTRSAFFCDSTKHGLLVCNRCFGTTCQSLLLGPLGPVKIGPIGCPQMSVTNYQSTLGKITEELRSHLHRGGRLKSHLITSVPLNFMAKRPRQLTLTFRVPCIVSIFRLICFQQDASLHSSFISGKLLYMFRVVSPPIIGSTHDCIYSTWYLLNRNCYLPLPWMSWSWFECDVGIVLIRNGLTSTRYCKYSCVCSR